MKLWKLEAIDTPGGAWDPWYDKAFEMVVRAETKDDARKIAQENAADENRHGNNPWLDPNQSTCVELTVYGEPGLIVVQTADA